VLGWAAEPRARPDNLLWQTLKVSADFKKNILEKYEIQSFQTQANLSTPLIVIPQIGGAITFSKRNYKIAGSIDHASNLAREAAAAAIVLIFDERRGIHFACDGADIIEILCLEHLRALGLQSHNHLFSHPTALLRLETWYHSSFVSTTGTYITGDYLVREATKQVSQLLQHAKDALKNDSALLYWLLEDVLRGSAGRACKAPRIENKSWHKVAFEYPPLIFSVGELDSKLLNANDFPLIWKPVKSEPKSPQRLLNDLKRVFLSHYAAGGIVGRQAEIGRWFLQAKSFYVADLKQTENQVSFGRKDTEFEFAYEVVPYNKEKSAANNVFAPCITCPVKGEQRCLHYIE